MRCEILETINYVYKVMKFEPWKLEIWLRNYKFEGKFWQELCQNLKVRFCQNLVQEIVFQNKNFAPQNRDFDCEFGIWDPEIHMIFKLNPKSVSANPFEFQFGTQKFEIANNEHPKIYIFTSKFKFFRPKSWFGIRFVDLYGMDLVHH